MKPKEAGLSIVGVLCALAVCGPRTASAQASPDPCKLLTQAQVSSAVGRSVGAGQPIAKTGCSWSATVQPNSPNVTATLALWDVAGWEKMKTPIAGLIKTPATGIGDDAFYTTTGNLMSLSVKTGGFVFIVRIYGVPDQSNQMSIEKTLAGDVVARR